MRTRTLVGVVVLAFGASSCGYARGHVEVIGPVQQGYYFSVTVDAVRTPNGMSGTAEAYRPGLQSMMGEISCLAIDGNRATIGVDNSLYPGTGGLIYVEDNGPPEAGLDVVNAELIEEVPTTCTPPTDQDLDVYAQIPGLEPVYSGDISVGVYAVQAEPGT